jgi:hypothetical protein
VVVWCSSRWLDRGSGRLFPEDTQVLAAELALVRLTSDRHSLDVGREEKKTRSQNDNQKASEITPMALHNDTSSSVYSILIKASSRGVARWGCPIVHLLAKGGSPVRF